MPLTFRVIVFWLALTNRKDVRNAMKNLKAGVDSNTEANEKVAV